ncbi:MAG: hypothetical protein V3T58_00140 [Candidatus Hydrothermarchaeales archaeon]
MVEKVMVCEECGKMFRISYDLTEDKELKCPSCDSINTTSVYRQENKKIR